MKFTCKPVKIPYTPKTKITNTEQLPRGTGCKFLVALIPFDTKDGYIAKQWHRKMPAKTFDYEVVICF